MRIVIAEDAALFRQGLTLLLQDGGHDIVATAADADSARLAVASQGPSWSFSMYECRPAMMMTAPSSPPS